MYVPCRVTDRGVEWLSCEVLTETRSYSKQPVHVLPRGKPCTYLPSVQPHGLSADPFSPAINKRKI